MKILIFSGYNPRAIISFCRLAYEYNLDFDIIASSKNDEIFNTIYAKNVSLIRETNIIDIDVLLSICESYKNEKLFILPSTEFLNRILISNAETLYEKNVYFGLSDKDIYESVSDKLIFGKLCKNNGISVPMEYNEIQIPCVLKPKTYFNSNLGIDKPQLIINESDIGNISNTSDFYIQEYVEGESIYLLYYISKDGNYSVYSQKNYIQQPNGGSILLAESSNHYTENIGKLTAELFIKIGFIGLVMVEFRKTSDDWVMIEANPRLWGPSQLILDSGMNLFDLFLYDNGLTDYIIPRNYETNVQYLWYLGMGNHDAKLTEAHPEIILTKDLYNRLDTKKIFKNE